MVVDSEKLEGLPEPGRVVADKYRIESVLGMGGMGAVMAATHIELERKVAIKFLYAQAARDSKRATRFLREARIAARLRSDHIAHVTDTGTWADDVPYMVMEFLEGNDLTGPARSGGLAVDLAVSYILQASEGLAEAHAAGVVHRDLKPANLFLVQRLDGRPHIKVLDFGIAKILDDLDGVDITKTTALMGSPLYMPPERLRSGKSADPRGDIWALGSILFELLTGKAVFEGDTLPVVCSNILSREPRRLADFRPDAPAGLGAFLQRCLQKELEARYRNLAEMAVDLAVFGGPEAPGPVSRITQLLGLQRPPSSSSAVTPRMAAPPPTPPTAQRPTPYGHESVPLTTAQRPTPTMPVGGLGSEPATISTDIAPSSSTGAPLAPPSSGTMQSPAAQPAHAPELVTSTAAASYSQLGIPPKRGRLGLVAGALLIVAGGVAAAFVLGGFSDEEPAAANATSEPSAAAVKMPASSASPAPTASASATNSPETAVSSLPAASAAPAPSTAGPKLAAPSTAARTTTTKPTKSAPTKTGKSEKEMFGKRQ